jgi:formylglycine-generating enzyme
MKALYLMVAACSLLMVLFPSPAAWGDVLNMGGTRNPDGSWNGLASLETVPVLNINNPGALSGAGAGGVGPTRVCGSVGYMYNIGRYEVTAGQYCEFLNKVAGVDTYGLFSVNMWYSTVGCRIERYAGSGTTGNPYQYRVAADYANRPVNYVSFGSACRFANWLHNGQPTGAQGLATTEDGAYYLNGAVSHSALLAVTREADWKWAVTSEDEWYKAAYYNPGIGGYYEYPTGTSSPPGRDPNDASGNNANYFGHPYPIQSPYYTTVVGQFKDSQSPYSVFDLGGNLWEWNEAVLVLADSFRGTRGGCFNDLSNYLQASYRYGDYPESPDSYVGFRVVQVPEPATLSLLAVGGLLIARRRRA